MIDKKKYLSIIAAICLAISSICFLIIPFYFDNKITELEKVNIEYSDKQEMCLQMGLQANHSIDIGDILKGFIISTGNINKSVEDNINEKISFREREAATFALNAYKVSKQIFNEDATKLSNEIDNEKANDKLRKLYISYLIKAGEGTTNLWQNIEKNRKEIAKLRNYKNKIWYFALIMNSIGLLLNIIIPIIKINHEKSSP